jgi:hypothetical protein
VPGVDSSESQGGPASAGDLPIAPDQEGTPLDPSAETGSPVTPTPGEEG